MAFLFPLKRDGGSGSYSAGRIGIAPHNDLVMFPLIHHQGIICGVAFDRSSLRRIAPYASVVAPRRLAFGAFYFAVPFLTFCQFISFNT